jgi:hypothetical protein
METNRDAEPLTDAERARRYRARLRGEDVPLGKPGRRPEPEPTHAERALEGAGILYHELGWLHPGSIKDRDGEDLEATLGMLLDMIAPQIARLRPGHDSASDS